MGTVNPWSSQPPPYRSHSDSADRRELNPVTHYVIVRKDLSRGVQAAQLVHAAGESSPGNLAEGTYAVVLEVPDEAALRAVKARLSLTQVALVAVYEPDPPFNGQLMALGLVPVRKEAVRRFLSSLPLLK